MNDQTEMEKMISKNNEAILKLSEKISKLKAEETKIESEIKIKKCFYYDKGYCKNIDKCIYFLSYKICK